MFTLLSCPRAWNQGQNQAWFCLQELEEPAERDRFQSTIPQQLTVIWNTLQAGDEGTAQEALELFIEVAEAHPRFLRKNLTEIVNAMLQVGAGCRHGKLDVLHLAPAALWQMCSDKKHKHGKGSP